MIKTIKYIFTWLSVIKCTFWFLLLSSSWISTYMLFRQLQWWPPLNYYASLHCFIDTLTFSVFHSNDLGEDFYCSSRFMAFCFYWVPLSRHKIHIINHVYWSLAPALHNFIAKNALISLEQAYFFFNMFLDSMDTSIKWCEQEGNMERQQVWHQK